MAEEQYHQGMYVHRESKYLTQEQVNEFAK